MPLWVRFKYQLTTTTIDNTFDGNKNLGIAFGLGNETVSNCNGLIAQSTNRAKDHQVGCTKLLISSSRCDEFSIIYSGTERIDYSKFMNYINIRYFWYNLYSHHCSKFSIISATNKTVYYQVHAQLPFSS